MRHHLLSSTITSTAMSSSSSSKPLKKPNHPNSPNYPSSTTTSITTNSSAAAANSTTAPCKHTSPSATTLDLLILVLVLFSFTFLISSYFSYISQSLSLLFPPNPSISFTSILSQLAQTLINPNPNYLFYTLFAIFFVATLAFFDICCLPRSRKCGKSGCKGLKNALEFDLQLQGEKCLRSDNSSKKNAVKEIDELPWKGGTENNPDYECLRAELRKMAPPNGRAVLLFRAKCGCPVAKLEGWGPKRGRRHKK